MLSDSDTGAEIAVELVATDVDFEWRRLRAGLGGGFRLALVWFGVAVGTGGVSVDLPYTCRNCLAEPWVCMIDRYELRLLRQFEVDRVDWADCD